MTPPYDGAFDLPERGEVVALFPFADGQVVLYREDQPGDVTYFDTVECFTNGTVGLVGGGPGETWRGCYWRAYSDAGYLVVIVEDPSWHVVGAGGRFDFVEAGDVGAALVEGTFSEPPTIQILDGGGPDSAC